MIMIKQQNKKKNRSAKLLFLIEIYYNLRIHFHPFQLLLTNFFSFILK